MEAFWFWTLVILLVIATFAYPAWPYTRNRGIYRRGGGWRYAPATAAAMAALLIFFLFWIGLLAITWPWMAEPVPVN
ncbi:MAG: hypothetical protein WBA02_10840 [Jannaschia helgolandensis]|jgi:uncharacterized membrane protein YhaH (DUF805 family)|uniref:Uncharacterized protein n=1 Tax=Jannaschia helgolandensis TaxID=188906 RepID=A0A1H7PAT8_9RHOB|nr:hypothetical protein [Jannaschia helgolandensis]SEL32548.1 hypothetical protein SAMN04488526_2466 [Jannaschia helgolandensis]